MLIITATGLGCISKRIRLIAANYDKLLDTNSIKPELAGYPARTCHIENRVQNLQEQIAAATSNAAALRDALTNAWQE